MPSPPNPAPTPTRRTFCLTSLSLLLTRRLFAQPPTRTLPSTANSSHPDVAAVDHDRILAAAALYLTQPPTPITSLPSPHNPSSPNDYYSEALPDLDPFAAINPKAPAPPTPFTVHRDALFTLGLAVPALTAAHLLTGDPRYAAHAALWLRAWFIDPATRMSPSLDYAHVLIGQALIGQPAPQPTAAAAAPPSLTAPSLNQTAAPAPAPASNPHPGGRPEGILETLPLIEIAQSIPFLAVASVLDEPTLTALRSWFSAYLHWLTDPHDSGPRLAALARDRRDHHGTSWLLQVTAYSLLIAPDTGAPKSEDTSLTALRHRFKTLTLRAQISPDGYFPADLRSPNPYRDSLFNLDMMAALCHLLSTRFESVWDYALEEGPSMRSAIAYHFPFIADRARWPYRADATHFAELPARRVSLLLCARAYLRPEYAALWLTLPPDPPSPDILRTLPIHQPLLWVRQPPTKP